MILLRPNDFDSFGEGQRFSDSDQGYLRRSALFLSSSSEGTRSDAYAIFRNSRGDVPADLFADAAGRLCRAGVRSPNHPCLEPARLRAHPPRFPPPYVEP